MATKDSDELTALQTVYNVLKGLEPQIRERVISSVFALLGIEHQRPAAAQTQATSASAVAGVSRLPTSSAARPLSLVELMQEKAPKTMEQKIALFAYYRERYEGQARFSRDDLEPYFGKAKLAPAGNYARDFVKAVKRGWIHEDGSESYLTSKGVEAVESGFQGSGRYSLPDKRRRPKKKKAV